MTRNNFPTSLRYYASLHDEALLQEDIKALPTEGAETRDREAKGNTEKIGHPMMDALHSVNNLTQTENGALAYKSTLDNCLNLDMALGPYLRRGNEAFDLLEKAYEQDPLLTVRIIFGCRSIHQGKGERDNFYLAFSWLLWKHPQVALDKLWLIADGTIEFNVNKKERADEWMLVDGNDEKPDTKSIILKSHGYWKDLLNLVKIYTLGEQHGPTGELQGSVCYKTLHWPRMKRKTKSEYWVKKDEQNAYRQELQNVKDNEDAEKAMRAERSEKLTATEEARRALAQSTRRRDRVERHKHVDELLSNDPTYRALHFKVARLFADQLRRDKAQLEENQRRGYQEKGRHAVAEDISLAGKWAPTLGCSHDKFTFMATSIAELLFPPDEEEKQDGEARRQYLHHVRERYRKEYLAPLRVALDITERRMSERQWSTIDFSHVPSKCMQLNSDKFATHAEKEFTKYLEDVALGKRTTSGGTLNPHELVVRANEYIQLGASQRDIIKNKVERDLVNAQWNTLVKTLRDGGLGDGSVSTLGESLAICDVSGSMYNSGSGAVKPIWPAIGLSLLLAELGRPPFTNTIITFSSQPEVVTLPENSFVEQVEMLMRANWGYDTNFEAVFLDLLLPLAEKHKLRQEDMVKQLFVLSDMHFNPATDGKSFETVWETIERRYEECGYKPPHIVWWNLTQGDIPMPVTNEFKNCTMVNGFSASMLKSFMEGTPLESETKDSGNDNMDESDAQQEKERDGPAERMAKRLAKLNLNDTRATNPIR